MNPETLGRVGSFLTLGQAGAPAQSGGPNFIMTLLPLLLIVVLMYFMMIRPQQRRQKAHQAMLAALKTGDEIITSGGLYGTVAGIDAQKNVVHVKVDANVKLRIERSAIARVTGPEGSS